MATEFEINRDREQAKLDALLTRKNRIDDRYYNGIFDRYVYPVVTRTASRSLRSRRATLESTDSVSGITQFSSRIPARTRQTYMI